MPALKDSPGRGKWEALSYFLSETRALGRRVLSQNDAERKCHLNTKLRTWADQGEVPSSHCSPVNTRQAGSDRWTPAGPDGQPLTRPGIPVLQGAAVVMGSCYKVLSPPVLGRNHRRGSGPRDGEALGRNL